MEVITSPHNQHLKLYRSLEKRKYRDELGMLPLEGVRLVAEVLERGIEPEFIFLKAGTGIKDFPFLSFCPTSTTIITIEEKLFEKTAFTDSPQGILAIVRKPAPRLADVFAYEPAFILVADRIQDPGNLGTMLRSAVAAGAGGTILLPGTVDPANPKALRASMGAYFALPVVEAETAEVLEELQRRNVLLVTAAAEAALAYDHFDWTAPVAIVIGNEGHGVSEAVREAMHAAVTIPMAHNMESLNAAVAMSILFFEAARQRRR